MNQPPSYMDVHSSHFSAPQSYASHGATAGPVVPYSHYQQQPPVLQGSTGYPSATSYSYTYANGIASPSTTQPPSGQVAHQMLPLPPMSHSLSPQGYLPGSNPSSQPNSVYDPTGQSGPPNTKPRVTATLWEDEGTLCYQVEAKGVCVARREDNHMINGTKLLNVAGMTRGRRDGILKSEKVRHVVKIGPMHLKGVWIPFERALDFANKEKITDLLYPLFVHNIGGLLYHPANQSRTNMVVHDSQQRRLEGSQAPRGSQTPQAGPPLSQHPSIPTPAPSLPAQPNGRPPLDRAHTFPTPTSTSSLLGISNQPNGYDWNSQSISSAVQPSQPLSIDTGLSNTRSLPTTPATTPPGNNLQTMQSYQNQSGYDAKTYYSAAPVTQSQYAQQTSLGQPSLGSYGTSLAQSSYMKGEMGPPAVRPSAETEHTDVKNERYTNGQSEGTGDHNPEYIQEPGSGYSNNSGSSHSEHSRNSYTYSSNTAGEHALSGTHSHSNGNDHQMTPRTATTSSSQQWQGFSDAAHRASASSSVYNVVSDARSAQNGDSFASAPAYTPSSTAGYSGSMGSTKRLREEDDRGGPRSDPRDLDYDAKRRKTLVEPPVGGPFVGLQPVTAGGVMGRRR